MKKIIALMNLLILIISAKAQNGLEKIIVEKYYVSDTTDSIYSSGTLPVGSVTYRIFADMLPGYKFLDAYGSPQHPLIMSTTTTFFNNTDFGSVTPSFSANNAKKNTVMLDSWLSAGGACNGYLGILKTDDNGVGTFVNSNNPKLLQNNDTSAGIPLTVQDGMISGSVPSITTLGIDSIANIVFGDGSTSGNTLRTDNGAWACLAGAKGPDSAKNIVLIAQITTDGDFFCQLNLNIGTPSGGTELYVASNPDTTFPKYERTIPSLTDTIKNNNKHSHTGINNLKTMGFSYKIYPSPAVDEITLDIKALQNYGDISYKIIDVNGRILVNQTIGKVTDNYFGKIEITSLEAGTYTFVLSGDDSIIASQKFIKK